jgi:V4R domain/Activator of aromatic catabolism
MPTTVRVPDALVPLFDQAERFVRDHFERFERRPERGTIHVGDERYVLVRAASLTTGFLEAMRDLIGEEEALKFWYRMARFIGRDDARAFCAARGLTDGPSRLSTGPVHFAYTGWARVEIDDRSRPASDDTYYLEYVHPNTFESESWLASGKRPAAPVCVFSAGYSAGWCSESFGIDVHAREITCVAAGQGECRFIMAPWGRLDERAREVSERAAPAGG